MLHRLHERTKHAKGNHNLAAKSLVAREGISEVFEATKDGDRHDTSDFVPHEVITGYGIIRSKT